MRIPIQQGTVMTLPTPRLRIPRIGLLCLAAVTAVTTHAAQTPQSHADIAAAAREFLDGKLRGAYASYQIEIGALDPRLRLAPCAKPLHAFLPPGSRLPGNTTVGVSCGGASPWTLYVPAKAKVMNEVVVLRRLVTRDTPITADDVGLELREIETAAEYIRDPAQVMGKLAKRPLAANTVLTPAMLSTPRLVRRGQQVVLVAATPGMDVRVQGIALDEGGAGDLIKVRNVSSKRVVEATVIEAGVAQVAM